MTYLNLRILGAEVIQISVDSALPVALESSESGFMVLPLQAGLCGSGEQDQFTDLNRGDMLVFSGKRCGFLATTNDPVKPDKLAGSSYPGETLAGETLNRPIESGAPETNGINQLESASPVEHGALNDVLAIVLKIQLCEIMKGGLGDSLPDHVLLSPTVSRRTYITSIAEQIAQISDLAADISKAKVIRFTELLLFEALDLYLNIDSTKSRLIRGSKDLRIADAIRAVHENPEYNWTVSGLAGIANMSRSLFADKFKQTFGETPLTYVRQCRIHRAKIMLTESIAPLDQIADQCGYTSQSAFIKAFSTSIGYSPGRWRTMQKKQMSAT